MKHIKKFENVDYRDMMSDISKEIHDHNSKEFYVITVDKYVMKYEIPEEYRGEFEEEYSGGDYGEYFKDTAEYISIISRESDGVLVIMDYEIDGFIEDLQLAKKSKAQD